VRQEASDPEGSADIDEVEHDDGEDRIAKSLVARGRSFGTNPSVNFSFALFPSDADLIADGR
jgi:hypothetical protein